jgi:diguanylate cyclase (GGDEF)-like protein
MEPITLETGVLLRLLDVSRRMAEQRAFAPLLTYVVDTAMLLAGAERGYLVLLQPDGALDFRITRDRGGSDVPHAEDQISTSVLKKVIDSGEALILRDALSDANFQAARSVINLSLRSIMCVPLISYGKTIGAIYVENRSVRGRFNAIDLTPLLLFANQATVALENATQNDQLEARVAERTRELIEINTRLAQSQAELQQRMRELEALHAHVYELSIRDSLTGLYNRRYVDEQFQSLFAQAERYGWMLTAAIVDIDDFKEINDTFSHQIGDKVLKKITQVFQENTRRADIVARYGGEEFIILFPETSLEDAQHSCERIRAQAEHYDWDEVAQGLRLTISLGLAHNQGHSDPEQQLRQADARLYLAKQSGKNRVIAS